MIAAIVLAAGMSTRFGRNKSLERVGAKPMIVNVVAATLRSRADEVLVVLGHQAARIKKALESYPCSFVWNRRYKGGQSSSVIAGLRRVHRRVDAVVIIPGDTAFLKAEFVDAVIEAYRKSQAKIVVATYRGRHGHPVLFDKSLFERILRIDEESQGLKAVLDENRASMNEVGIESEAILWDVDTQLDLERFRALGRP